MFLQDDHTLFEDKQRFKCGGMMCIIFIPFSGHNSFAFEALLINYATQILEKKIYSFHILLYSLATIFAGLVR